MRKQVTLSDFVNSAFKIAVASAMCLMATAFAPSLVRAQTNLLLNPGLTAGSGNSPLNWENSQFGGEQPGDVTFEWEQDVQPPDLEIWNYQPADARWTETVHLKPGWYHFTASVRTENVGEDGTGANISVLDSWFLSRQVKGSGFWETVGFYMQVPTEGDVILACRLGFYSSTDTGRAWFRDLSLIKVDAPASDGDPTFKLYVPVIKTAAAQK
jgi:hypothetical protein